VYSLLKHEHKNTTVNCTITTVPADEDEGEGPVIKSKDVLVVQVASRRYECRPVFSQPLSPASENNLRKFERYLQPGRMSVASWLGPTAIGKDIPVLFFKRTVDGIPQVESIWLRSGLQLVATGSLMAPTPPIIVKRAILTGHPYRVHKKVVTMRYMFFNREDVLFFKPVQLVSKQGRRGWIKEPLGTHGITLA
jgi:pre-rRNA-processing protein TSR1